MSIINFSSSEITDVLNNPYMGWAPSAERGPYIQPHRLVYVGLKWSDLEPVKGNFAWTAIENKFKLSYWFGRKIKIVLRFIMDYPGEANHMDIPAWLYQEINGDGSRYSGGFSPNYKNPSLISNHRRVINALAQRYNNNPGLAFIQIGSIGHWGEFHTLYLKASDTGYMPDISISNQYVTHYLSAFTNKRLLMRRPFQIAKDNNLGLYNDMFADKTETERHIRYFNNGYANTGNWGFAAGDYPAMPDFWKYGPSAGEFGGVITQFLSDATIAQTIRLATESHTSFLGPRCPADPTKGTAPQKNIDALHNIMGYRFVLQSTSLEELVQPGSTVPVTMVWNNKGVAPFYYDWPLELSLINNNGSIVLKTALDEDIRSWLPGIRTINVSMVIPENLPEGTYNLCIAIIDPETNSPGIDLAITGKRSDGRYSIGNITVKPNYKILIDGDTSDWDEVSPISVPDFVKSLRVTNDNYKLYFLVEGTGLNTKSSFYIKTDNSLLGYNVPGWPSSGCDYLVENNILFRYTGAGNNPSWSQVGTIELYKSNNIIEAAVPLSSMQIMPGQSIKLGYVLNDTTYFRLPSSGQPLANYLLL